MKIKVLFIIALASALIFSSCAGGGSDDSVASALSEGAVSDPGSAADGYADAGTVTEDDPAEQSVPSAPDSVNVVVLGDSIARGYGLKNVESERYSALLEKKLGTLYENVGVYNYGVDGWKGSDLLDFLRNDPPEELADSDYVIISIGGNNILSGLYGVFSSISLDADYFTALTDYYKYLFSGSADRSKYEKAVGVIDELLKTADDALNGEAVNTLIETASSDLSKELPEIIAIIKERAPGAKILLQTIYNPYKDIAFSFKDVETTLDVDVHGDRAVSALNEVIESNASALGYSVVPVYTAFKESRIKLINAGLSLDLSSKLPLNYSVDPHPNAEGHKKIAELCFEIIGGAFK